MPVKASDRRRFSPAVIPGPRAVRRPRIDDGGVGAEMIRQGDKLLGVAVTLGQRYQFFTAEPRLLSLDGRIFETTDDIHSAIGAQDGGEPRRVA